MNRIRTSWPRLGTATVATLESLALLGYAFGILVISIAGGLEGPEAVSSPMGAAVEVMTFALFGAGVGAIAWSRWQGSSWSGPPFVLTQLLALTVGVPLLSAPDTLGKTLGTVVTAAATFGLVSLVAGALQTSDHPDAEDAPVANDSHDEINEIDLRDSKQRAVGRPGNQPRADSDL